MKLILDLDVLIGNFIFYITCFLKRNQFTLKEISEYEIYFTDGVGELGYRVNRKVSYDEIEEFINYYPFITIVLNSKGVFTVAGMEQGYLERYFREGLSLQLVRKLDEINKKYFVK